MTNRRVEYIYTDYYRRNLTRRKWQLIQEFLNLEKFSYRNGFVIKSILIKWKPQLPFYAYFKVNIYFILLLLTKFCKSLGVGRTFILGFSFKINWPSCSSLKTICKESC